MTGFSELALLIGLAALFGLIAHRFRQPLILGYIAAGVLLNQLGVFDATNEEQLRIFSQMGIVFLLFILGLDLDIRELVHLGPVAFATGIGQILFTTIVGTVIALVLGYNFTTAMYLAIALTFSSTIVIVKLLSQKKELDDLHGKISVGFLLVQDFIAIVLLILISASNNIGNNLTIELEVLSLIAKFLLMIALVLFITEFVIPKVMQWSGHDREVLFIVVIAWALLFAALVANPVLGFSIEIGALAAGIALSSRKESLQIESWTRPLRDFFLTVFFVLLGLHIELTSVEEVIIPALIFSAFVLIGNPLIVMAILGVMKFRSRTGFKAGLAVAQISEFSLLLANVGLSHGQITSKEVTLLTIVGGITMTASSYMIYYDDDLYERLKHLLHIFERKDVVPEKKIRRSHGKVVVFGYRRMAAGLGELIEAGDKKFLVVDNDPQVLQQAEKAGATTLYGDLTDNDLLRSLQLDKAELVISTVPDKNANLGLLIFAEENKLEVPIIVPAFQDSDAVELYDQGASFVLYPYLFTSQRLANIVDGYDPQGKSLRLAAKERALLKRRQLVVN